MNKDRMITTALSTPEAKKVLADSFREMLLRPSMLSQYGTWGIGRTSIRVETPLLDDEEPIP